jgi:phosphatidylinositol-4-phosphate 3-kinase
MQEWSRYYPHLASIYFLPSGTTRKALFSKNDQDVSQERRPLLEEYLRKLAAEPKAVIRNILCNFLEISLAVTAAAKKLNASEPAESDCPKALGELRVAVFYLEARQRLYVDIVECRDLSRVCDVYIKAYLLPDPDKKTKLKTKVRKATRAPVFNELIEYDLSGHDRAAKELQLRLQSNFVLYSLIVCANFISVWEQGGAMGRASLLGYM